MSKVIYRGGISQGKLKKISPRGHGLWTHPPDLTGPLTARGKCVAIVVCAAPITKMTLPALPHLPVLLTTPTRRRDDEPPCSVLSGQQDREVEKRQLGYFHD